MEPKYTPTAEELDRVANAFTYHQPTDGQRERYTHIRDCAGVLATILLEQCPPSRERSIALQRLNEVVFWSNAAIARNE